MSQILAMLQSCIVHRICICLVVVSRLYLDCVYSLNNIVLSQCIIILVSAISVYIYKYKVHEHGN